LVKYSSDARKFHPEENLNYNFKGKTNVGRTKHDLQLKSGDEGEV
jgi:hypothetical protein